MVPLPRAGGREDGLAGSMTAFHRGVNPGTSVPEGPPSHKLLSTVGISPL